MTLKQSITELILIPSGGGAFEVTVNGENIYSKLETGSFPDFDDILSEVKQRL